MDHCLDTALHMLFYFLHICQSQENRDSSIGVGVVVVHSIQLEKLVVPNGEDFNNFWQKMQNSLTQL